MTGGRRVRRSPAKQPISPTIRNIRAAAAQAEAKARMVRTLGSAKAKLHAIVRMLKAYASGKYKRIPLTTIAALVGAILYFLNPMDMIPDAVPVVGYLDDAALIAAVAEGALAEISAFEKWEITSSSIAKEEG